MLKHLASMTLITALTGCAMGWTRPGTSEAEFYRDRFDCDRQAASMYPPLMTSAGGYTGSSTTNCVMLGSQMSCSTTPGASIPPSSVDSNAAPRAGAFGSCMRSKGYVFKVGN